MDSDPTSPEALRATPDRGSPEQISEELETLYAMTTDLIAVGGFDGFFRRVNPAWTVVLGWSAAEMTASPWLDFVHPDDVSLTVGAGGRLAAGERVTYFQNRYRTKDGSYRWLDWTAIPLTEHQTIYCIARDVTGAKTADEARVVLEKRLLVADRMVSIGTLAAGVAHEINNPLSYVMANLDMVIEEVRALSGGSSSGRMRELEELAIEAREGAERVRKIVRGLKTFTRAEGDRRGVMDIRPAVELAVNMAFNEIRHRARLVKEYGTAPLIEVDDARLGQVLTNLLVNAAQAIPAGNADGNEIRVVTSTDPRGWAVIEVRDSGPGIPTDVLTRIFEPFFTTKAVGIGTGLGLSICQNIISGMDGEISVSSTVGSGTTFRIAIPPAATQQLPQAPADGAAASLGKGGSILVVDDEPLVGMALRRILREHDVTVVTSVHDALAELEADRHFDIIFSDLMMPQMTGMDFYRELTHRFPEYASRIVFVTGGAFTPDAVELLDQVANERIDKPFAPKTVRELVSRFLPRRS